MVGEVIVVYSSPFEPWRGAKGANLTSRGGDLTRQAVDAVRLASEGGKKMMKRMLTAVLIVVCFLSVKALPRRQSLSEIPCGKYGTQAEANACARRDYEKAEAEMRGVYGQLMTGLAGRAGEEQQKLEKAQSLWLRYREANCESEASIYEGGSIRPAIYNSCLASVTRERAVRLRGFLTEVRR